jgi:hypothetical protein
MSEWVQVSGYERRRGTVHPRWILVDSDTMLTLKSIRNEGWATDLDGKLYTRNQLKRYLKYKCGKEWETTHPHMIMLAVR